MLDEGGALEPGVAEGVFGRDALFGAEHEHAAEEVEAGGVDLGEDHP